MQQTSQYKLNLIESGDTFSAAPLNENAEKLETTLAQHTSAIAARAKCSMGTYTGTGTYGSGKKNTLTFQFEPKLVLVMSSPQFCLFLRGLNTGLKRNNEDTGAERYIQTAAWDGTTLTWYITTTNGAAETYTLAANQQLNAKNTNIAIG